MGITIVNTPDYVHSKIATDPKGGGGGSLGSDPKTSAILLKFDV